MDVKLRYYVDEKTVKEEFSTIEVIKEVGIGKNQTKQIVYSNKESGFYKNSALITNAMLDNLEFFISIVGQYVLGVNMAQTLQVYDMDNNPMGIISKNVAQDNERLITFSNLNQLLIDTKNLEIQLIANQISELHQKTKQTFFNSRGEPRIESVLENEEDIKLAIDMFPMALDYLNLPEMEKEEIKKDYFKMIILDLVTGQIDRNNDNYGIVANPETDKSRFAQLFDNSTIHIPGLPTNFYYINGFLIDRKQMINCLLSNYGEYATDIIGNMVDNRDEIISRTEHFASQELSQTEKKWFMTIFKNNLDTMSEVTIEKRNSTKK